MRKSGSLTANETNLDTEFLDDCFDKAAEEFGRVLPGSKTKPPQPNAPEPVPARRAINRRKKS